MPISLRITALALCLATLPGIALAEKADREKPVTIKASKASADDRNKVQIFEENVRLVQGTLEITTDKLVVSQDAEGFQKGVATGGKDGLARFRQKREGRDEYIEGEAERIEYDGRTDTARLFVRAQVRSGPNESRGPYIEYNGYTELYTLSAQPSSSVSKSSDGVTVIIAPRSAQPARKP
ncbi:lipopolysaccharide transport periplasmic protein LptA [Uliginosibacterium aquaticum]|uniref:Lipopolysaccharide export system protein LptA n=1 Tax=Uliginosibacterium aquaticum TaxID=2731212 RepID=A0ABX2IQ79_9RHOO|nr:lipopolysaccharide transport periplasmic protein LptA [Uliginosibacterium aquaticum]NSL56456.1 lipopolysaccharide transport periplasmic protein LptA [Uliginosibacterium aquaticum]